MSLEFEMYRTFGGILLVAGTTVGAGMLALPIVTGFAGFFPSCALFFVYWLFMTYTALLMLEVNLWMKKSDGNMITMAAMTLGPLGKWVSWIAYLFLLYALTTAYLAGGGPILNSFIADLTGWRYPQKFESVPLLLIFGAFIYRGTHSIDHLNRLLMGGLIAAYLAMIAFLTPHVKKDLLQHVDFPLLWVGTSVVATSFGFHIIIPSLTTYLKRDVGKLKKVILIGSTIPLFVYLSWQLVVLGIVPLEGPISLSTAYREGANGATLLSDYLGSGALAELTRIFSFLAILTSFLGVSMSLSDFLADGLKIERTPLGNLALLLLTFIPPVIFALTDPRAFLSALEYAGAFGVMFLLALLPALMVWRGRKHFAAEAIYRAPGGVFLLGLTIAFSLFAIGIEILQKMGLLILS